MFWRRQWPRTPVLLPGKSHGWRSLQSMGSLSWARLSYFTFTFHFHFSLSCIGEGNGNALQCSCLENPRDGGACWAAVCGVVQSRTRLKWLSSKLKDFNGDLLGLGSRVCLGGEGDKVREAVTGLTWEGFWGQSNLNRSILGKPGVSWKKTRFHSGET